MADAIFEEPRLAEIYDPLDPDRSDLDAYAALADEFSARTVLDIGCGTGTFACLLAGRGVEVIAVDPAAASLNVARRKPGAGRVRWLHGDATTLPPLKVDLATMTGNVAQVFLTGEEWAATLAAVRETLRPGGRLVFESRDPAKQAWLEWNRGQTYRRAVIQDVGLVETWTDLTKVEGNLVSFRMTFVLDSDSAALTSDSTLRFRSRDELADSLAAANLDVEEVRDAPDRPGREFVFIARRAALRQRNQASWLTGQALSLTVHMRSAEGQPRRREQQTSPGRQHHRPPPGGGQPRHAFFPRRRRPHRLSRQGARMTSPAVLADGLRSHARGLYCLEAAAELLITQSWLHRDDFTSQFITVHPGIGSGQSVAAAEATSPQVSDTDR